MLCDGKGELVVVGVGEGEFGRSGASGVLVKGYVVFNGRGGFRVAGSFYGVPLGLCLTGDGPRQAACDGKGECLRSVVGDF